jgi:hypothetical protein
MFNIGAGVDALLKLRLPRAPRVVRLDDAGMSVQMAEYVCHAVIRHFREFDGYEADVRRASGPTASRACAGRLCRGVMGLGVLGERVAQALAQFEFPVNGWSRSPKAMMVCAAFSGHGGLQRLSGGQPRAGQPAAADARTRRTSSTATPWRACSPVAMSSTWRAARIWWTTTCWRLVEVGPRDGLQNEAAGARASRSSWCTACRPPACREIEVTSFVSPKWVPQMADNAEVMAGIQRQPACATRC